MSKRLSHRIWHPWPALRRTRTNDDLMAATIEAHGATFNAVEKKLFPTRIFGGGLRQCSGMAYDVSADGRFRLFRFKDNLIVNLQNTFRATRNHYGAFLRLA